ncbi:helix-turn-helix transcriptional regulator [uncultured Sphaerochaeta sp.]|uniref:helix-turn-helix transcriptional regulator n=1 Tax=uncultured Sphaerochaeta sp. TaxID=886478 RepID=UPI002A0A1CC0|nr:helix-turn-helix transcriptional regulator [uncultured Sphaerochaeta sp.]
MKKKKKASKTYFKKMIFLYTFLIAFTSVILTLYFYKEYSGVVQRNYYDDSINELKKDMLAFRDLENEAHQIYTTINIDSEANRFISLTQFNPTTHYRTYLDLKKIMMINPYVYAIGLSNILTEDTIFCGKDTLNLEEGKQKLLDGKGPLVYTTELTGIDDGKKALVFAYPFYAMTYNDAPNGVFIVMDQAYISEHILGPYSCEQVIADRNNNILLHIQDEKISDDQSYLNASLAWIDGENQDTGSHIFTFNHTKYICSFAKETASGRKYLSLTTYDRLLSSMTQRRNIFLSISISIMFLSLLLQFFISRKLYQPIKTITTELGNSKFNTNEAVTTTNEFEMIHHFYTMAMDEINHLEQEKAILACKQKNELLRDLILNSGENSETLEKLEKGEYHIPFEGMFLFSVVIDKSLDNSLFFPLVRARIQQLMNDSLTPAFYLENISLRVNEVVGLINAQDTSNVVTFDILVKALEKIKEEILGEYPISLTIGLDGIFASAKDCNKIYQRVKELQNNRFVMGDNQIIYPKRVMELFENPITYPDKIITEIVQSIIRNNQPDFEEKLDAFIETLRQYTYKTASLLFARLYLDVLSSMQNTGSHVENDYLEGWISLPGTLEEGRSVMFNLFKGYQKRVYEVEKMKGNKHYQNVKESEAYVMAHYTDLNLNVDVLADRYRYSSSYFARIFKSINGLYINDYIRQVRIMKAKELLQNSDLTINEIAVATGFTTSNYFYSIFKKETGLTPATYRNVT